MPKAIPYNRPLPSVLPTPTAPGFDVRMNQFVRFFFQLKGTPFASEAAMKLKANWDALIAASDSTKVIYTPLFSGSKVPQSKALEMSTDTNATFRGLGVYFGEGVSMGELTFLSKDGASMNGLADITPFSQMNSGGQSSLVVYPINNDGHIFCNSDFSGILIYNFALRTRGSEGLNSPDIIGATWQFEPNWDANIVPVIPSFDPRNY